ncbi:MAG: PTS lactose/cellobiose transporter subunit IIA [Erysipelotrichaceae bacterium]|nr:PTS lactose/cellobiose transporter subunit IIA [Erysipelotrichaceae bacterium]MBR2787715.1 PTS lactose/cellobiose transporter subunit IIA [Erysipelotrichaceae bacterium]
MNENNPLIQISMQIILNAGDARTDAFAALECAKKGDFEAADAKIATAEEGIKRAHQVQTDVLQEEMSGTPHELCILFIHAQDTLMTIKSELSLIKELIEIYRVVKGA